MRIEIKSSPLKNDAIVLFAAPRDKGAPVLAYSKSVAATYRTKAVDAALSLSGFSAKAGEALLVVGQAGTPHVVLSGLGEAAASSRTDWLKAGGAAVKEAGKAGLESLAVVLPDATPRQDAATLANLAIGMHLAAYKFTTYKSNANNDRKPGSAHLIPPSHLTSAQLKPAVTAAVAIAEGVCVARDLGNLPGNDMTPTRLGEVAQEIGAAGYTVKKTGTKTTAKKTAKKGAKKTASTSPLKVTVYDHAWLKKQKMGGILGVNAGSALPPVLIVMDYPGPAKKNKPTIVLVGKGLTFDAGGISLKPGAGMGDMKFDMCGGAAVVGAMHAVAQVKPAARVIGVVPSTENMPDGLAYKPGDILTMYSGKTVEIDNTDAEGRLILADALTYASRTFKPDVMFDLATLTGACVVALGNHAAGIFTHNDDLAETLTAAGNASGDRVWRMPMWDEYGEQMKSKYADVRNTGGREGGACSAAWFLSQFVDDLDAIKYAHIDIAGTSWAGPSAPHKSPGGTGYGVQLLIETIAALTK